MVKRALTLLTSILIALPLLMPFNIYADTLPQSEIVGVTYNKIDQDVSYLNGTGTYTYIYEVEVLLRNKYVGIVDGTLSYTYSQSPQSQTVTTSKRTYVNGDSFKLNVSIVQSGSFFTGSSPMYSASFLVNSQNTNVTKYEDLNSIETVVSILQDIYANSSDIENLSTNQLTELEKIVSNTSLANDYLDIISKLKSYTVPIESLAFTASVLRFDNNTIIESLNHTYSSYPIISVKTRNYLYAVWSQESVGDYYLIIGCNQNINTSTRFNQYFEITNAEIKSIKMVYSSYFEYDFAIVTFSRLNKGYCYFRNIADVNLIPVYIGSVNNKNLSTEFALQWGLTNQLLDDIHVIANGTVQSNSAAQSTDSANSQLQTDSNTLFEQENGFKSDMQSAMQNVNNTFRLQDMGTKFVSSAQWVRTQYEQLTNNTPFASLITFSLITGLALILLGKVYK